MKRFGKGIHKYIGLEEVVYNSVCVLCTACTCISLSAINVLMQ